MIQHVIEAADTRSVLYGPWFLNYMKIPEIPTNKKWPN